MSELSKGHTYNPGDVVDAADLNNLVDAGTALKGIVMDQPSATPILADDSILFHDLSADNLARCKISALGAGTVTSVAFDAGYPQPVTVLAGSIVAGTGTTAVKIRLSMPNQTANKVLASPTTGTGAPLFRALAPTDIPIATSDILALDINWDLGVTFKKGLLANVALTFSNANEGQTIRVALIQGSPVRTVSWVSPVRWKNGTVPVMTPTSGCVDIFTFHKIGGVFYGTADQNFHL